MTNVSFRIPPPLAGEESAVQASIKLRHLAQTHAFFFHDLATQEGLAPTVNIKMGCRMLALFKGCVFAS